MNRLIRLLSALLLCSVLASCATQGKPGTPLPPQNKAVGEKWPPEVREFIDTVQVMFVRGKPTPSDEEIERGLKFKFGKNSSLLGNQVLAKKYIGDWQLGGDRKGSVFTKMEPDPDGSQYIRLELLVDSKKYCINPYDFAIYTGRRFKPDADPGSPFNVYVPLPPLPSDEQGRPYDYDYVWGMFQRSPVHTYRGTNSVRIAVTEDERCISQFEINTFFQAIRSVSTKG